MTRYTKTGGFTLAELLIALAILGVIATFTIPKVLQAQTDGSNNAIAKEAAAAIYGAYSAYQLENTVAVTTGMNDFTPYLNYIKRDTVNLVDHVQTQGNRDCSVHACYLLSSGAMIWYYDDDSAVFDGTGTLNAMQFFVDPDGVYSGTTDGAGKSIQFYIYANGRVTDRGSVLSNTVIDGATIGPNSTFVPPWFSWD